MGQKQKSEKFLAEAYGCIECTVDIQFLNADAIQSIRNGLKNAQPEQPNSKSTQKLPIRPKHGFCPFTFRFQRSRDDAIFKPPVPYPIQTVDVVTIDADRKYDH